MADTVQTGTELDDIFSETTASEETKQMAITYLAKLGGRKFVLAVLMYAGSFALCWFGKINEGVYSVATVSIITAYLVSNVAQKKIT